MPTVNNNLTQIPNLLASKLPAGSIKLSHNVTNIAYNTTGVTVSSQFVQHQPGDQAEYVTPMLSAQQGCLCGSP